MVHPVNPLLKTSGPVGAAKRAAVVAGSLRLDSLSRVLIIEYADLDKGNDQMPNDISVDADLGIIEVRSYGDLTKEDVLETIARVVQTSILNGIDKILADTSGLMNAPGFVDLFDISANFPRKYKHALLMRRTQSTAESVAFFETVGRNRGHRVRLFTDREAALEWLQDP